MSNSKPKLSDLARVTGLSISSVSRALRNSQEISEEMKHRVLTAASAMDYTKHLKRPVPSFLTLTVYTGDIDMAAQGSIYKEIFSGVADEARLHNLRIIRVGLAELLNQIHSEKRSFEALLLLGFDREEYFEALSRTDRPIVLVNSHDPYGRIDSVLPDNLGCGALVAKYLEERGLRSTLHVVHRKRATIQKRLDGYFDHRNESGESTVNDIIIDPDSFEWHDIADIRSRLRELIDPVDLTKLDSVVCWGLLMKKALLDVAPRQFQTLPIVSVDSSEDAPHPDQELATVALPGRAIGRQAVQQLVHRQFYADAPCSRLLLAGTLTKF